MAILLNLSNAFTVPTFLAIESTKTAVQYMTPVQLYVGVHSGYYNIGYGHLSKKVITFSFIIDNIFFFFLVQIHKKIQTQECVT